MLSLWPRHAHRIANVAQHDQKNAIYTRAGSYNFFSRVMTISRKPNRQALNLNEVLTKI